jgi:ribosomal protein S18 acetylase RimI-like enzyme
MGVLASIPEAEVTGGRRHHGPVIRRVGLPGNRTLVIRRETPADAGALVALYDRLGDDDRYRRFFSARRPPDRFIERMTRLYERGGVGLVAVLQEGRGVERIVGEAGYELLDDGDGELGITVDSFARGWLGPYLLDALVEQASARGVRNIQAEVLMTNGRMLAVLRSRGMVTLASYDSPATLRVAIGAARRMPAWPGRHDRPRVLVEAQGATWLGSRALQAGGFQVVSCPGPVAIGCGCPALKGEPCPLVTAADAVVVGLPTGTEVAGSLLEAHRRLHPEVPMCAWPSGDRGEAATALPHPPVGSDGPALVDFLQGLIAGGRREDGAGSDQPTSEPESDLGP